MPGGAAVTAVADLHVEAPENRAFVERLAPADDGDWLIVAGDVGDLMSDLEGALALLADRFDRVLWVPGNHDLWTRPDDPSTLRGEERYRHIVSFCRELGVTTPEDEYPVWEGPDGPVAIAPLFTLYDYSFGGPTKSESLSRARGAGVMCSDEVVLFPDPHPSIDEWCRERVELTLQRLEELPGDVPSVLISHFPLVPQPTRALMYPEFAQWCGTLATRDWHTRFRAIAVVYGHLHIPRTTVYDGVRFEEVSLGYPRQWRRRRRPPSLRRIL